MSVNWLTGKQLNKLIIANSNAAVTDAYIGIFAINTLPPNISTVPVLLVVNNDTSNLPGRHWKAIFISAERHGEVFDSSATPVSLALETWMNTFTRRWVCSTLTIQHPLSPSCGGFVLHYILHRLGEKSLKHYTEKYFVSDLHKNEDRVRRFVCKLRK